MGLHAQVLRLFVAIELDQGSVRRLSTLIERLAPECEGVRWTRAENLHLTVRFIGPAEPDDVQSLVDQMLQCTADAPPLDLRIEDVGCFGRGSHVRTIWAGVNESTGALSELADQVDRALDRLGFPSEGRRYSPHITLGRVKEDRTRGRIREVVESTAFTPFHQPVDDLVLMASRLASRGPTYSVLARAALDGTE